MLRPFLSGAAVGTVMATAWLMITLADAQQPPTPAPKAVPTKMSTPKAGPGEKVCRYTFPSGEKRAWVCKKEEPCCAWDAINYVKCGSVAFNCL
jgi:hypothetical protein